MQKNKLCSVYVINLSTLGKTELGYQHYLTMSIPQFVTETAKNGRHGPSMWTISMKHGGKSERKAKISHGP
jgi:hypothetical protein